VSRLPCANCCAWVREIPANPAGGVQEAARYGRYDLDRLERMILAAWRANTFSSKDGKESDDWKTRTTPEEPPAPARFWRFRRTSPRPPRKKMLLTRSSLPVWGAPQWPARQGERPGVAHPARQPAERWSLETFPYRPPTGRFNRKQMRAFAELEFNRQGGNIVLGRSKPEGQNRIGLLVCC